MKTQNAYNDHIGSKKHKEIELKGKKGPKQPRKVGPAAAYYLSK